MQGKFGANNSLETKLNEWLLKYIILYDFLIGKPIQQLKLNAVGASQLLHSVYVRR